MTLRTNIKIARSLAASALLLLLLASPQAVRVAAQTPAPTAQAPTIGGAPRDERLWKKALEIQRKAIIIDGHNNIPRRFISATTSRPKSDNPLWGAVSQQASAHSFVLLCVKVM